MRPVCPGFPAVLAPCLLGGRMLGPGRLVQFRRIGLDQQKSAFRRWLLSAISAGRSHAAELLPASGSVYETHPRWQLDGQGHDGVSASLACAVHGADRAGQPRSRQRHPPGPTWVRQRYTPGIFLR